MTLYSPPFPSDISFRPQVKWQAPPSHPSQSSSQAHPNTTNTKESKASDSIKPRHQTSTNIPGCPILPPINLYHKRATFPYSHPSQSSSQAHPNTTNTKESKASDSVKPRHQTSTNIPGCPILPPINLYHKRATFPYNIPKGAKANHKEPLLLFLDANLRVPQLAEMHHHLWWAGRPGTQRSLHHQRMMRRDIYATENPALHLIWVEDRDTIYIKPLPAWLLDYDFVEKHICSNEDLYRLAMGFLRSYTKLIRTPLDFSIADELKLVPKGLEWEQWSCLAAEMSDNIQDKSVDRRYIYGELRLGRLNHIRRYCYWGDHYHSVYVTYDQFFSKNFAWLLLVVVYLSVILAAMQVVLSTDKVTNMFSQASYWFSAISIVVLAGVTFIMAIIFVTLFIYHLICTIINLERKKMDWVGKRRRGSIV